MFLMGQSRPLFVYFRLFYMTQFKKQIDKSVEGVLGTGRMEGVDESTELWQPPFLIEICCQFYQHFAVMICD